MPGLFRVVPDCSGVVLAGALVGVLVSALAGVCAVVFA